MQAPLSSIEDFLFGFATPDNFMGLEIFTDDSRLRGEGIRLQVTAQQIAFGQQSRISEQLVKDGRAFFFWKQTRESNHLDLLELNITGFTRSLQPGGFANPKSFTQLWQKAQNAVNNVVAPFTDAVAVPEQDVVTNKQNHWLRLWKITREPFMARDHVNQHYIRLKTPALPIKVLFSGHFAGPIQWTHDAKDPFLAQWSLKFIVHSTIPSLDVLFERASTVVLNPNG